MTTDIKELMQSPELLIENGQQTADLLRHLANNEIDSDYFAVVSECEAYGQETEAELSITEFALRAAGCVDALIEALEAKDARIAESEQRVKTQNRHVCELFDENTALRRQIAELQSRAEAAEVLAKSHQSLRDSMAAIHNTIRGDGAYVSLSVLLSASRRAYEESAQAAKLFIQIQGGE